MHKEHYKHVRSWNEPENDKKNGVELCPFTATHYKLKIKEKGKEIERLREKIVRAYACIEDKLYDKALNILQQALKEE